MLTSSSSFDVFKVNFAQNIGFLSSFSLIFQRAWTNRSKNSKHKVSYWAVYNSFNFIISSNNVQYSFLWIIEDRFWLVFLHLVCGTESISLVMLGPQLLLIVSTKTIKNYSEHFSSVCNEYYTQSITQNGF